MHAGLPLKLLTLSRDQLYLALVCCQWPPLDPTRLEVGDARHQNAVAPLLPQGELAQTTTLIPLPIKHWLPLPDPLPQQVGGCLTYFEAQWSALGASPSVLNSVQGL